VPTRKKSNYETTTLVRVPHSRNGKHKELMAGILSDLETLQAGMAMKIPLKGLGFTKEKIRSALNRATAKMDVNVATASDATYLYVWKTDEK
jgi:hypothetical protein